VAGVPPVVQSVSVVPVVTSVPHYRNNQNLGIAKATTGMREA